MAPQQYYSISIAPEPQPPASKAVLMPILAFSFGTVIALASWTLTSTDTSLYAPTAVRPNSQAHVATAQVSGNAARSWVPGAPVTIPPQVRSVASTALSSRVRPEVFDAGNVGQTRSTFQYIGAAFGFVLAAAGLIGLANPALAFDNAIPEAAQYAKNNKSPGDMPKDLNMLQRKSLNGQVGLKECGGAPNCFSTSGPDAKHQVAPLLPPAGKSTEDAISEVKSIVEKYPPGQEGIDGGGFKIITSEPGYLYIQFESLQSGFIDDVEFSANPNGDGILWRTSSRQGYLDLSVNAKRLNWILAELRKMGWTAPELNRSTHLDYFKQNNLEFFPWQK